MCAILNWLNKRLWKEKPTLALCQKKKRIGWFHKTFIWRRSWKYKVFFYQDFLKNAVMSPDLAALDSLRIVAHFPACCDVTNKWQGVHRVRRLSISHCPPPSQTGRMWSTCQNWFDRQTYKMFWGYVIFLMTMINDKQDANWQWIFWQSLIIEA